MGPWECYDKNGNNVDSDRNGNGDDGEDDDGEDDDGEVDDVINKDDDDDCKWMTSSALKRWERPKGIHAASNLNVIIVIVTVNVVVIIMVIANITNYIYKVGRGL